MILHRKFGTPVPFTRTGMHLEFCTRYFALGKRGNVSGIRSRLLVDWGRYHVEPYILFNACQLRTSHKNFPRMDKRVPRNAESIEDNTRAVPVHQLQYLGNTISAAHGTPEKTAKTCQEMFIPRRFCALYTMRTDVGPGFPLSPKRVSLLALLKAPFHYKKLLIRLYRRAPTLLMELITHPKLLSAILTRKSIPSFNIVPRNNRSHTIIAQFLLR